MSSKLISTESDWNFEIVERFEHELGRLADEYRLDTYPNQLEIISSEQMMDAYAFTGLPVNYTHWSFGKHFIATEQNYRHGQMGLAYEMVINSNPCISYLMEENTLTMQALVIAHAAFGHNSFFKGNYLFRTWTNAEDIVDYMVFARDYVADCERRHGEIAVEQVLDACHALMNYGVDSCRRPQHRSAASERQRLTARENETEARFNDLWRTLPREASRDGREPPLRFPAEPQENLLYFIEKQAPHLEAWQRELVRIVRKVAQYFYPQRQTKVMNEGWATFWHYTLLNRLFEEGLVGPGFMLEFLESHTGVTFQPGFDDRRYRGINPYALGFAMMRDIQRICMQPDAEDQAWFPDIAGSDWITTLDFAMRNFKDESFIAQYLSPKLIRQFRLFSVLDDDARETLAVTAIHDDAGYAQVRRQLAQQYAAGAYTPDIQVHRADLRGDRSLTLRHTRHQRRPLAGSADEVLRHTALLWGRDVRLEEVDEEGEVLKTRLVKAAVEDAA
jgi:spore cortex formation protein SpoVR/YcgB (stage V sporulation)